MSRPPFPKDIMALVTEAQKLGWEVTWTRGSHIKFMPPKGSPWPMYVASGSPSDIRGRKNAKAFLKQCGVEA